MGLITKEVEVKVGGRNDKWFEEKGYDIPKTETKCINNYGYEYTRISVKQGTTIIVKVEDLPYGSQVKVDCECDECRNPLKKKWQNYIKENHDGKLYCQHCFAKVFRSGENSLRWNPNKTQEEREQGRICPEYIEYIKKVMIRDNYTCKCCGNHADVVHHLYAYACYPEYKHDEKFGLALCNGCHDSFHTWHLQKYGWNECGKNTKEQFEEWSGMRDILLDEYDGDVPTSRWAYCITDNEIIKNIIQYSKEKNLVPKSIYDCCNGKLQTYKNKIYIWYNIYIVMSEYQIKEYIKEKKDNSTHKEVVCLNYKLIFSSTKSAGLYFGGIDNSTILKCCKGKYKYAGISINGEELHWAYMYDIEDIEGYTFMSDDEVQNKGLRCDYPCEVDYSKKIVCITYNTYFASQQNASKYYNINSNCISDNLGGRSSYGGKHPITGKPLYWMRGKEYIEQYGLKELRYITSEECEKGVILNECVN